MHGIGKQIYTIDITYTKGSNNNNSNKNNVMIN